ncbi:hypothetical protein [Streptomyces sp. NPDC058644]|uniref:hypothetical protein n=1 Tax=unclassified Streptomyces TaxID=2593676 RepID=UPI0036507F2F
MTTFVITIPGTFLRAVSDTEQASLMQQLRPADPQHTALGESEDLNILTVNDDGTFCLRLEVEAVDSRSAEQHAKDAAAAALRQAGIGEEQAPLGPTAVTGIDT